MRRRLLITAAVVVAGTVALVVALVVVASPAPRAPSDGPRPGDAWVAKLDAAKVGDEAFATLRTYLMVDTTNPPGREAKGARVLADVLAREGIAAEVVEAPAGRANLIARLPGGGGGAGALCLVSHIDVASSEPARWPAGRGPFEGAVVPSTGSDDDVLWGRGALDMKSMGVVELYVMIALKRLGVPLARDVVLLAVADEEVDGAGMKAALDEQWSRIGCTHAINEGSIGVLDAIFPGQTIAGVSVGEKGHLWLRLTAEGPPGHGSTPVPGRAPERLLTALAKIGARVEPTTLHPAMETLLANVGAERGGPTALVLNSPLLLRALVLPRLASTPLAAALVQNTISVTGFAGRKEPNVVPSLVEAQLDVRLLPGTTIDEMVASLQATIKDVPQTRLEVISAEEALVSPTDDPLFEALTFHAARGQAHVVTGPVLSPGSTDSTAMRKRGVHAYGFMPFVVTKEEAQTMHGDGERVSRGNVRRGVRTLFAAVVDFVAAR